MNTDPRSVPVDRLDDSGRRTASELLAMIRPPAWHADAACKEHPEVDFFPRQGESTAPALAVCAACLVLDECRTFAVKERMVLGVWGGTTGRQRIRSLFKADRHLDDLGETG